MKRTINLANAMCLIWSGASSRTGFQFSRDAIERLRERALREIIVIDGVALSSSARNWRASPPPLKNSTRAVPRAFLSYSWESGEHRTWVARFAERLRTDGSK